MGDWWFISEGGKEFGPYNWPIIIEKVRTSKISNHAYIRSEESPHWVPIAYYFPPGTLRSPDEMGIIPSRWDLLFYFGVFVFLIGIFAFITNPALGGIFFLASPGIEIFAVMKDKQTKIVSTASKLGNMCALGWIVVQIAVSLFFTYFYFSATLSG